MSILLIFSYISYQFIQLPRYTSSHTYSGIVQDKYEIEEDNKPVYRIKLHNEIEFKRVTPVFYFTQSEIGSDVKWEVKKTKGQDHTGKVLIFVLTVASYLGLFFYGIVCLFNRYFD